MHVNTIRKTHYTTYMSQSPYFPRYSEKQKQIMHDKQQVLLTRWTAPPYTNEQHRNYRVEYVYDIEWKGGMYDMFRVHGRKTRAWENEYKRHGFVEDVGSSGHVETGTFYVYVPHTFYLSSWLPMSCDVACCKHTASMIALIAVMSYMLYVTY